jgi:hypothetical protein
MSVVHVKKQAAEADQMIEELNKAARADQEAPENPTPEGEGQMVSEGEHEAQLAEVDQGVAAETGEQPVEPDEGDWRAQAQLWEQRYRSLNGMIQSRDRQIQQLHELLASMQEQQGASATPKIDTATSSQQFITKEDEDSYGADLVDMARRAGRQESAALVDELRREMAEMRAALQGVSQVSRVTVQERFESKLDKLTKNTWRAIDSDPEFIAWLQSSPARNRVFAEGVQSRDATTVADFFNDFAKLASIELARTERPVQARLNRLEKQVAPGKSKAGAAPSSQAGEAKQWTRSEIAKLYANKKQYTAEEFNKLERDVAAAQREGRVDFNR